MSQGVWELNFTISLRTPKPIPLWTPKDREIKGKLPVVSKKSAE